MSITFNCPHCHRTYRVKDELAGRKTKCKVCQTPMTVPRLNLPPPTVESTPGGAKAIRHKMPVEPPALTAQTTPFLPQITRHIRRTIGPSPMVFHEIVSPSVHIDLHVVPPTGEARSDLHPLGHSHFTIITSGISSKPMNIPPEHHGPRLIELMVALPGDWPGLKPDGSFTEEIKKEENWWPFRWLKQIARVPSQFNTFLGPGHTIPNGEDATPYASNTQLGCMLVTLPQLSPQAYKLIINDNATICFLTLTPLYQEEMNLKLEKGSKPLQDLLERARINELIDPRRKNVMKRRFGLF